MQDVQGSKAMKGPRYDKVQMSLLNKEVEDEKICYSHMKKSDHIMVAL